MAEAARIFAEEIVRPALAAPPGLAQLTAVCEAFFAYLERRTFPGGCFMASAALEMGARPGPVRDLLARVPGSVRRADPRVRGHRVWPGTSLPAGEDPDRLAFELNGIMLATDTNFVLHDDPAVLDLARQIVHQRLGGSGLAVTQTSVDFPGVVARQQGGQVAGPAPAAGGRDLLRHQLVVAGLLDLAEHPDRGVPEVRACPAGTARTRRTDRPGARRA